jgi:hypothetical protein
MCTQQRWTSYHREEIYAIRQSIWCQRWRALPCESTGPKHPPCRFCTCTKIAQSIPSRCTNNIGLAIFGTRAFARTFACHGGRMRKTHVCAWCPDRLSVPSPKCKACARMARSPLVPGAKIGRPILKTRACKVPQELATVCLRPEVGSTHGGPIKSLSVFSCMTSYGLMSWAIYRALSALGNEMIEWSTINACSERQACRCTGLVGSEAFLILRQIFAQCSPSRIADRRINKFGRK